MLRAVSIAAVLGALFTLAAEHRTQAQNVPGVIFADAVISARTALAKSVRRGGSGLGRRQAGRILTLIKEAACDLVVE
jgi:hypothetical protein